MITTLFGKRRAPPSRRSIENPNTPLSDPAAWLVDWAGGGTSSSGAQVNRESAMTFSPVYRAVALISGKVAGLPLCVYKRVGEDGKERDKQHPAYKLLKFTPNPWQTYHTFRLVGQARALLLGNSYSWIQRDGAGRATQLIHLDPIETRPIFQDVEDLPDSGQLFYVTKVAGQLRKIPAEDVLHIRGMGSDFQGKSVLTYARESIGLSLAMQKFAAIFFANGSRPSAVLEHPATLSAEAETNLRRSWNEMHTGLDNVHKMAILEEGMKLHPFTASMEDSQLLQSRQFSIRDVSNWFGVSPHKLGDTSRTSYNSLQEENQSFLDDGIDPWLITWEAECRQKLLSEAEKEADSHLVEFVRNALARANLAERGAFYHNGLLDGWLSRDEVRGRETMNPMPDGLGEKFFEPKNMGIAGEEPEEPPAPQPPLPGGPQPPKLPPPEGDDNQEEEDPNGQDGERALLLAEAHRGLVREVTLRLAKRLSEQAKKRAKKPDGYMDWLETGLQEENHKVILESFAPVVQILSASRITGPTITSLVAEEFMRQAGEIFLTAADSQPKDLVHQVECAAQRAQIDLPVKLCEFIWQKK